MIRSFAALSVVMLLACSAEGELGSLQAEWSAEPSSRIGSVDGVNALSSVDDVIVGADSSIYVLQTLSHEIARFSSDGVLLSRVGRSGNGPGEFRMAFGLGWKQDTLWVVDWGRIHFFDSDLRHIRTVSPTPNRLPDGVERAIPGSVMTDGSLLMLPVTSNGTGSEVAFLMTPRGEAGSVLTLMPMDHLIGIEISDRVSTVVQNPWSDSPLIVPTADGESIIVVHRRVSRGAETGVFEIMTIDLGGDTTLHRKVTYRPLPLAAHTVDSLFKATATHEAGSDSTLIPRVETAMRGRIRPPSFEIPVTQVVAGEDGSIWLRREAGRSRGKGALWQVYDEAGEDIGSIHLPPDLRILRANASTIWVRVEDSLGVPYVQKFDIVALTM